MKADVAAGRFAGERKGQDWGNAWEFSAFGNTSREGVQDKGGGHDSPCNHGLGISLAVGILSSRREACKAPKTIVTRLRNAKHGWQGFTP